MGVHDFENLIQSKLLSPSINVPGWYRYDVNASNFRQDLEELRKFKNEKIIIYMGIKSKYNQDGVEPNRLEDARELMSCFRGLNICQNFENLDLISGLTNLEVLMIHTQDHLPLSKRKKSVDLNGLERLRYLTLPIAPKKINFNFFEINGLDYLSIPHFDENDATYVNWISGQKHLRAISMHRPKMKTLDWLQSPMLRFLQIDYAKNLQSLSGGCTYNNLEHVDFQNCPNLTTVDGLSESKNLMLLRIWGSLKLETLSFLKGSSIQCLDFYESNVEDGDLSFIQTLKDLKHLRFTNKRHFSHSLKDYLDKESVKVSTPSIWCDYEDKVLGHFM